MKTYDIESQLRQIVFQRTREWLADGKRLNALAAKAGVNRLTVSKLAYGETKHPRFHTVIAVCDALGVQLTIGIKVGSPEWVTAARAEGSLIPRVIQG